MTDETTGVPAARGQFVKGHSGNPAGRPKGSKNAISLVKLQIEGELRSRMKKDMHKVVEEIVRQALPHEVLVRDKNGTPLTAADGSPLTETADGDKEMLKLLFGAWVPKARAGDDEAPKEKIQIIIGKLDQVPPVNGVTYQQSDNKN